MCHSTLCCSVLVSVLYASVLEDGILCCYVMLMGDVYNIISVLQIAFENTKIDLSNICLLLSLEKS